VKAVVASVRVVGAATRQVPSYTDRNLCYEVRADPRVVIGARFPQRPSEVVEVVLSRTGSLQAVADGDDLAFERWAGRDVQFGNLRVLQGSSPVPGVAMTANAAVLVVRGDGKADAWVKPEVGGYLTLR
jgi:hypothetical protein